MSIKTNKKKTKRYKVREHSSFEIFVFDLSKRSWKILFVVNQHFMMLHQDPPPAGILLQPLEVWTLPLLNTLEDQQSTGFNRNAAQ